MRNPLRRRTFKGVVSLRSGSKIGLKPGRVYSAREVQKARARAQNNV